MKYSELSNLVKGLEAIKEKKIHDLAFNMSLVSNIRLIKRKLEEVEELRSLPPELKEFEKKIAELRKELAVKTEDGKPEMTLSKQGPTPKILPEDEPKWVEGYEKLLTEYQEYFEKEKTGQIMFAEKMNSEVDFDILTIKYAIVEKHLASDPDIIDKIFDIIEYEDKKKVQAKKTKEVK